jgi:uncharacterized protein
MPAWWDPAVFDLIVKIVALFFMLLGLALLLIPILPGLVIIWAVATAYGIQYSIQYGIQSGFGTLGWVMFALMTVLMVVGSFVDNVLMGTRAHKEGAPWWVVLLALLAAIPGTILLPFVGGVLAALLTVFLLEWARLKNIHKAFASMRGLLVGYGWAVGIRFIIGMVMIGLWLIWAWV